MIPAITFTVVSVLSCPNTTIVNKSGDWTTQDRQAFASANQHCKEIYPDSPCLKEFRKMEEGIYEAICGEPKK